MAQLFELDEKGEIDLNKEWIRLNPLMNKVLSRDRGSKGDPQGREKRRAKRDFNYIRMMWSPDSEYESYPEKERREHVLKLLEIHETVYNDDEELRLAEREYRDSLGQMRSYRAWKAAVSSLDSKIDSLENYQPDARDKQGKLVLTPEQHSKAIKSIYDDMETVDRFKTMLNKEISQEIDVRKTLKKGLREDRKTEFIEGNPFA